MTRTSRRSALLLGASGLLAACARTGGGGGTATPATTGAGPGSAAGGAGGAAGGGAGGGNYTELKPAAAFSTLSPQFIDEAKAEWKAGPFGGRWPAIPGEVEFIPLPE